MNHAPKPEVQSHVILWFTCQCHEGVYKIGFQYTFRYFELQNHRYFNAARKALENQYERKESAQ